MSAGFLVQVSYIGSSLGIMCRSVSRLIVFFTRAGDWGELCCMMVFPQSSHHSVHALSKV
jgi:hypothetical protein